MAPLLLGASDAPRVAHVLQRRGPYSPRTFAIIFGVVALLVIVGCVIWGILIPLCRQRGSADRAISNAEELVEFRTTNLGRGRVPGSLYPSHPAVFHGPNQPVGAFLYNPRTDSPFPHSPGGGDSISVPSLTPRSAQFPRLDDSAESCDVLNPARKRLEFTNDLSKRTIRLSAGSFKAVTHADGTRYGDARDYVLPVPEPLSLKPRPAGRPPPLSKQLDKFPLPNSVSRRNASTVHPVKIFQELEQRDSKGTFGTSSTPCLVPSPTSRSMSLEIEALPQTQAKIVDDPTRGLSVEKSSKIDTDEAGSRRADSGLGSSPPQGISSSSDRNQVQPKLRRAGTNTKPKTPVAELRQRFNQKTTAILKGRVPPKPTASLLPKHDTTSQQIRVPEPLNYDSTTRLLPLPNPEDSAPQFDELPTTDLEVVSLKKQPYNAHARAGPSGDFYQASCGSRIAKPGRLKFSMLSSLRERKRREKRYSASSLSTVFNPIVQAQKHSLNRRGSSIYSRDTKGVSWARNGRHDSPYRSSVATASVQNCTPKLKSSSVDMLQSKIDGWDLHTSDLDATLFGPSAMKRTLSDSGLRASALKSESGSNAPIVRKSNTGKDKTAKDQFRVLPRISIGEASDDIFGGIMIGPQGEPVLAGRKSYDHSGSESNMSSVLGRGLAPGNAAWI